MDKNGPTGAGLNSKMFSRYFTLGPNHTSFDGELRAIATALNELICRSSSFAKVVILSDSQAAISSIGNYIQPPINNYVLDSRRIIKSLTQLNKAVALQWIPAHCGITGNEAADFLAKKATNILQATSNKIPFHRAATNIHLKIRQAHKADLTPCDFFMWGFVKDHVYVPLPTTLDELRVRITAAIADIDRDMLQKVWQEMEFRLDVCRVTRGAHIEYL